MADALADVLLRQGVVDEAGLQHARQAAAQRGAPLGATLVDLGVATERQIVQAIADQLGLPFVDCKPGVIDPEAARLVSRALALEVTLLPVAFNADGSLVVAAADPGMAGLDRVARETGLEVTGALAVRGDLRAAIEALASDQPAPAKDKAPGQRTNGAGPHGAPTGARVSGQAARSEQGPLLAYEQEMALDLHSVLRELVKCGGSDLHLTTGVPPMMRVHGELEPMPGYPVLLPDDLRKLLYSILTQKQREVFENDLELDLSYQVPGVSRFRVNIFQQRDSLGAVMRIIPFEIRSVEELGIPAQVTNFAHLPRGFVLVTGPTGSGKSTTLAGLIDVINRERSCHIMTVEDPIEFLHKHKRSLVNQRELGTDTHSFAAALKHVLRQDPDVILVGEMRDLETIQVALTAAETGHLVFGTLHTQDAPQTVDRIIVFFPPHQQEQIRVMLAGSLQGVVCQQLLKTADGSSRVAATEVMVATPAIRNLIREGKTHQMYSALQAGKQYGMVTMDQSLATLVIANRVSYSAALEKCNNVPDFNRLCGRA